MNPRYLPSAEPRKRNLADHPQPAERPERRRRTNNNYREAIMSTAPSTQNPAIYQPSGLPNLAPATAFSPAAPRDPATLTSSFRVTSSTPQPGYTGAPTSYYSQQPYPPDYVHSSPAGPTASQQSVQNDGPIGSPSGSAAQQPSRPPSNSLPSKPQRPPLAFSQFTDHMRPQLEADHYPQDQISARIQQEWDGLSMENKVLWDRRYEEQMMEYTQAMDEYKRQQKRVQGGSFSEGRNRGVN